MKAMILAAGRGERLRPLTDSIPKPLLPVGGKPIIEYTIESLVEVGFSDIVINLAYLGDRIKSVLGDGKRFNAHLQYSYEGESGLETAGGIVHALPLLGTAPFLVVNGDIATDFPYTGLDLDPFSVAHLVMVPNPLHHRSGDFALHGNRVLNSGRDCLTFSGIGVYRPELFASCGRGKLRLAPLLRKAITDGKVSGRRYDGFWMDIGTQERLRVVDAKMSSILVE